jgi:ectoine hydroxylase-related dioxygenase (phytanoyl-CoA dioxygenase family)
VNYAHAPGWALARVIALRVHLDASTADNGPLRVIPNSHVDGVLSDEAVLKRVSASEVGAVECPTPRGGVVMMRPLTIHSSSKVLNSDPRRVLHIEYADSRTLVRGFGSRSRETSEGHPLADQQAAIHILRVVRCHAGVGPVRYGSISRSKRATSVA